MKKEKGQSLVEVLFALAIVILVVLALTRAVTTSVKTSDQAKKKAQAAAFTKEAMEKVRSFRDQNSWTDFGEKCEVLGALGLTRTPAGGFTLTVKCLDEGGKKKVTVSVSWQEAEGEHESKLISYFTDKAEWK